MPFALSGSFLSHLLGSQSAAKATYPGTTFQIIPRNSFQNRELIRRKISHAAMVVRKSAPKRTDKKMPPDFLGEPCTYAPPPVSIVQPESTATGVHSETASGRASNPPSSISISSSRSISEAISSNGIREYPIPTPNVETGR